MIKNKVLFEVKDNLWNSFIHDISCITSDDIVDDTTSKMYICFRFSSFEDTLADFRNKIWNQIKESTNEN